MFARVFPIVEPAGAWAPWRVPLAFCILDGAPTLAVTWGCPALTGGGVAFFLDNSTVMFHAHFNACG